jgi:DNA-binding SARP family transcriptional activator
MSALRRSLTHSCKGKAGYGYIICKNRKYYLGPANAIHTDVDDFLQFYQLGQQKCEAREAFYEKACSLYTGSFLVEDLYADWSFLQRERLSQIYLTMCGVLTEHYLQIKSYEDATKWANAILKENRYDETAYRQLMQIYAAQGRRSEALQQYHRCEQLLREELGISPLPETMLALHSLLTEEPSLKNKAET